MTSKTANQALQEVLPQVIEDAGQILKTLKTVRDHGEQTSADWNLATAVRNVARRLAECREFMAGTGVSNQRTETEGKESNNET